MNQRIDASALRSPSPIRLSGRSLIAMLSFSSLIPLLGLGLAELLLLRFFILFLLLFFFCFLFLLLESLFDDLVSLLHFLLDLSSRWRGPLHPWVLRDALEGIPLLWLKL